MNNHKSHSQILKMSSVQEEKKVSAPKGGKAAKFQFDFSTTEDLFISQKGREYRNK
jgi:hypothetical protein